MSKINKIIEYLILSFLFLLPWQTAWMWHEGILNGAKWEPGTGLLYGTEILLAVTLLFLVVDYFIRRKFLISNVKFLMLVSARPMIKLVLLLFLLWVGLSVVWARDGGLSVYWWIRLAEGAALFFILGSKNFAVKKIYWTLVLSAIVQTGLSAVQFLTQQVVGNKWLGMAEQLPARLGAIVVEVDGQRWLRPYGSFAHPNILAGFLLIGFFTAIYLYYMYRQGKLKWLAGACAAIILSGLLLSFSRSAILVAIAGFVAVGIINIRGRISETIKLWGPLLVVSLVIIFLLRPLMLARVEYSERLEQKSITQRIDYINQSKSVITDHFWLGTGIGNYTYELYLQNSSLPVWEYQPVHNIYLLIWSELGIVGLIIFLAWCASIIFFSIRHKKYIAIIFGAVLAVGFMDHYFWTQYVGIMMLAIAAALALKEEKSNE